MYTKGSYDQVMKEKPNLIVLIGKKRDALALHYLREGFEGRDGRQSDPGRYSDDDTDDDGENADGERS